MLDCPTNTPDQTLPCILSTYTCFPSYLQLPELLQVQQPLSPSASASAWLNPPGKTTEPQNHSSLHKHQYKNAPHREGLKLSEIPR